MIPDAAIVHWAQHVPWATPDQVEQDLLLSRLIVAIADDPILRNELVFRGGTCLHKLHLPVPRRYSEDLDYVRAHAGGIGDVLDALRQIGRNLDLDVRSDLTAHPKLRYRTTFTSSGAPMRVKIEINTHERSTARDLIRLPYAVESPWWNGQAEVLTFVPEELVATKIRALHQRRKGRDLFDLWLAITEMGLDPEEILQCFGPYRPDGYTREDALASFDEKVRHTGFRNDLTALVAVFPDGYSIDAAAALVRSALLARV